MKEKYKLGKSDDIVKKTCKKTLKEDTVAKDADAVVKNVLKD